MVLAFPITEVPRARRIIGSIFVKDQCYNNKILMSYESIIEFWFDEIDSGYWWKKDDTFDHFVHNRFEDLHVSARRCELFDWRVEPLGRLAEIIILDQFSRMIYRDQPLAFSFDSLALALAQEAIASKANLLLDIDQKVFLYLPFMHSESPHIHKLAMELFSEPGMKSNLEFERKHKVIIDRFGRYPHRNAILGRQSTPEELKFLKRPGSFF